MGAPPWRLVISTYYLAIAVFSIPVWWHITSTSQETLAELLPEGWPENADLVQYQATVKIVLFGKELHGSEDSIRRATRGGQCEKKGVSISLIFVKVNHEESSGMNAAMREYSAPSSEISIGISSCQSQQQESQPFGFSSDREFWGRVGKGCSDSASTPSEVVMKVLDMAVCNSPPAEDSDGYGLLLASKLRLSFVLLNGDPSTSEINVWDFAAISDHYLGRTRTFLQELTNTEVDSQVFYYANELSKAPFARKRSGRVVVPQKDIESFWSSSIEGQWNKNIGSLDPMETVRRFVVFPVGKNLTVDLLSPSGSSTHGFTVPEWGGVALLNKSGFEGKMLGIEEVSSVMNVFRAQIREMLGLPLATFSSSLISKWEEDMLLRWAVDIRMRVALRTLDVLVRQASRLPNMVVRTHTANMVKVAINSIIETRDAMSHGNLMQACHLSSEALTAAHTANVDPSLYNIEDLSDEYKYGIYVPMMVPTLLPVAAKFLQNLKEYLRR